MKGCIWYDSCPFYNECIDCDYRDEEETEDEARYLSREDFYRDWFEYLERDTKD